MESGVVFVRWVTEVRNALSDSKQVVWREFANVKVAHEWLEDKLRTVNEDSMQGRRSGYGEVYDLEALAYCTVEQLKDMPMSMFARVVGR